MWRGLPEALPRCWPAAAPHLLPVQASWEVILKEKTTTASPVWPSGSSKRQTVLGPQGCCSELPELRLLPSPMFSAGKCKTPMFILSWWWLQTRNKTVSHVWNVTIIIPMSLLPIIYKNLQPLRHLLSLRGYPTLLSVGWILPVVVGTCHVVCSSMFS